MAHFAKVIDGLVTQVIVADDDFPTNYVDDSPGTWIQTSYNTRGGVHYDENGVPDNGIAIRGNYAGIGYVYDQENDVFYPKQPYSSWTISAPTWIWTPPTPRPETGIYDWDESIKSWILV